MIVVMAGNMTDKLVWRSNKDSEITISKAKEVIKILKRNNPDVQYKIFKLTRDWENEWKEEEVE